MSNHAVGNVYQAIIEEVINSSRVDFEESGVEDSVLEELRKVRCLSTTASSLFCRAGPIFSLPLPRPPCRLPRSILMLDK